MPNVPQYIRCTGCNKVIGEMVDLKDGKLIIECNNNKCKTKNVIEARPAGPYVHNAPYQNRMGLVTK